jgi:AmmeMemoRadiSam system protein B
MKLRSRTLPNGWYPASFDETTNAIEDYLLKTPALEQNAIAAVVPHAGWGYSGVVACEAINHLSRKNDTIVVVGGHLPGTDTLLAAFEEGYATPLGPINADLQLLAEIEKEMKVKEDVFADNTIEVQLPFIKYLFPESRVLAMRVSPTDYALKLGKVISEIAKRTAKRILVLGSTDLTHYGPNYSFSPEGSGKKAVQWVKEVNDKKFIDALVSCDSEQALERASHDRSACSAGGAACAASFAAASGIASGILIRYMTSWDVLPHESFVGYAGIIYKQ